MSCFYLKGDCEPAANTENGVNGDVDDVDNPSKKHESDYGTVPLTVPEEGLDFILLFF